MRVGNDARSDTGIDVGVADDGVEAVAASDLVVGEPIVHGLSEARAVLLKVLNGCVITLVQAAKCR